MITEKQVEEQFVKLLPPEDRRGRKVMAVHVPMDHEVAPYAGVTFDEKTITLCYTDEVLLAESDVARAILKHEVCHLTTLPTAMTPPGFSEDTAEFVAWRTLYCSFCEYMAHQEFRQRFPFEIPGLATHFERSLGFNIATFKAIVANYLTYLKNPSLLTGGNRFLFFADLFQTLDTVHLAYMTKNTKFTTVIETKSAEFSEHCRWILGIFGDVNRKKSHQEKVSELRRLFPTVTALPGSPAAARLWDSVGLCGKL